VGTFDIVTAPSGAQVKIDGKPKGVSPVVGLSLPADRVYAVEATLDGYRAWRTRLMLSSGKNPAVVATLDKVPLTKPAVPAMRRDITLSRSTTGDAAAGRNVFRSKCNSCHGNSASRLDGRRYTRSQWARYFATRRHAKHAPFSPKFTRKNLADVKSYLISRAADAPRATAAGVR
jgi:mono/diheme cytochrome c family protein